MQRVVADAGLKAVVVFVAREVIVAITSVQRVVASATNEAVIS